MTVFFRVAVVYLNRGIWRFAQHGLSLITPLVLPPMKAKLAMSSASREITPALVSTAFGNIWWN
jgi:hypothetical protein